MVTAAAVAGCDFRDGTGQSAARPADTAPTTISPPRSAPGTGGAADCVTSALKGSCGPYRYTGITQSNGQNTLVGQDVWNPIPGYSQTLHAASPGSWYVNADMPDGNTAVVSFPNVAQEYYYSNTLSQFSSISSSFAENMHPGNGSSAEASYDIWLNDWKNEVMIQHDIVNRGACPVAASASFGGSSGIPVRRWNLCRYGSELIWQLSGQGERSGAVDILAMLDWLVSHRYLPKASGLTAISYGFEICSTGGHPETFTVSQFALRSTPTRLALGSQRHVDRHAAEVDVTLPPKEWSQRDVQPTRRGGNVTFSPHGGWGVCQVNGVTSVPVVTCVPR